MYRELEVWKESVSLIKVVYKMAEALPKSEEYNLKQQLRRAVVSVTLNIAEGKNRRTEKDFGNFLTIAIGSLSEVDAIIAVCEELEYFKCTDEIKNSIEVLGKRINALRNKLQRSNG